MKDASRLTPQILGGGVGHFSAGCGSRAGQVISLSYTGETYHDGNKKDIQTADSQLMRFQYEDCEGSLYWLHKQKPIPFPYSEVCLGLSSEGSEEYLTREETRELTNFLLTIYTRAELANEMGVGIGTVSPWKLGKSAAPAYLRELAERVRVA